MAALKVAGFVVAAVQKAEATCEAVVAALAAVVADFVAVAVQGVENVPQYQIVAAWPRSSIESYLRIAEGSSGDRLKSELALS